MTSVPEPTLVLFKSTICRHCTALTNIWDTPPNKDEDSVSSALKKVYPKLRFFTLTAKDNTGTFDENAAPKDLIRYGKWFPMILLIPGPLWNQAMSKLGPKNDVKLTDGVQIMNGKLNGETLEYVQNYDIRKPADFSRWLQDALANEDFKRVQNGSSPIASPTVVPTIQTPSQAIKPIFSSIVKPNNTPTNYVAAGTLPDRHTSMEPGSDVCSMRIISRPKS